MNRLLLVTNVLLGIIAVCLLLLIASVYNVGIDEAHAQPSAVPKQEVILVYWNEEARRYQPVVDSAGYVKTSR